MADSPTDGILLWKNGHREPTGSVGGERVIYMHVLPSGRFAQTTFVYDHFDRGKPVYVEGETVDVSRRWQEEKAKRMVQQAIARGVALPSYVLQGRYPGETDEEFEARIEILRPAVATPRQSKGSDE